MVSIIIPCYNDGIYIDKAVESVLNQTYQDFEIIIVNDGSTDDFTNNKLDNFSKPKTQVIKIANRGLPGARNAGIEISRGKYIFPLDADDYILPSLLKKSVNILEDNDSVGVVTPWIQEFGVGNDKYKPTGGTVEDFLLHSNSCGNATFRKNCWIDVGGYDESMNLGAEDWDFWLKITKKGWKVDYIDQFLFYYRKHEVDRLHNLRQNKSHIVLQKILNNHEDIFSKHWKEVILKKEERILQLNRNIKKMEHIINLQQKKSIKKMLNSIQSLVSFCK